MRSFLSYRTQQTRVGSQLSSVAHITSGVVQGSVLGPLLFLLFINEIGGLLSNKRCVCKLYADDVKLYTTLQINEDCTVLQQKTKCPMHGHTRGNYQYLLGNVVLCKETLSCS